MKLLKPYLDAQILKLVRVLETPSLGGSSEQHNGWIALSQGGADWMLAAQKVVDALQGTIFEIANASKEDTQDTSDNQRLYVFIGYKIKK